MKRVLLLGMVLGVSIVPCAAIPQSQLEPPISRNVIDWLALFRQRVAPLAVPVRRPTYDVPELTISPAEPDELALVYVTASGWKPDPDLEVEHEDIQTARRTIQVKLHWFRPEKTATQQAAESAVNVPTPYEHTVCLGRLAQGTYTVRVTHCGAMIGAGSTTFKVSFAICSIGPGPVEVIILPAD